MARSLIIHVSREPWAVRVGRMGTPKAIHSPLYVVGWLPEHLCFGAAALFWGGCECAGGALRWKPEKHEDRFPRLDIDDAQLSMSDEIHFPSGFTMKDLIAYGNTGLVLLDRSTDTVVKASPDEISLSPIR